ncbi:M48 family metallopeptidase [Asticcacaulis sp. AC402]|uniref:tetratricopeptide repeat protein n=1 Tax=Asticcacaulis sp. AC402 TaxID=1282361 RepID=UPI0003C3ED23|nr:hypothetical protein [Asticcacaulis sp. AC402]ESQ76113.1 hypothetical protein ABAC402_06600 [Asticcacaulis sp. AC402]
MSGTSSTLEAYPPVKRKITPFIALIILAVLICALAAVQGEAPITTDVASDWFSWARVAIMWAGVFACGLVLLAIGLIGAALSLLPRSGPKPAKTRTEKTLTEKTLAEKAPRQEAAAEVPAGLATVNDFTAYQPEDRRGDDHLHVPTAEGLTVMPQKSDVRADTRGSLKFDAQRLNAIQTPPADSGTRDGEPVNAPLFAEAPVAEMPSLEPAIFHDNASDSFMSRTPAEAPSGFDPNAALSEAHGLNVVRAATEGAQESAKVIPIRPDITVPAATATAEAVTQAVRDPLELALLAEPTATLRPAPQSDIHSVISSAMRFIDTAPTEAAPSINGEVEIRQAIQTALSVWPDTTRTIAADELSVRVAHLYYDKDAHSRRIFDLIASGDLGAAASALQVHADALAYDGHGGPAAELWRVYGALHMGRDDSRAMQAYARVSELDPEDANIHLYLARRYQMAGETVKLLPVIGRALGVISDPAIRTELLTPFADLQMKAGNVAGGADALEELSRLHETTAYLKPDDIAARSSHAITLARLAQAREMLGDFAQAGPLYKKAHKVFADLSALKPEHPGLKAMADNALKDASRFGA